MSSEHERLEGRQAGPPGCQGRAASGSYRSTAQRIAGVVFLTWIPLLALLLLVPVGMLLWSFVNHYRAGKELEAALAEAKGMGVPTESTDPYFQKWGDVGQGEENGAFYYQQVFSAWPELRDDKRRKLLPLLGIASRPFPPTEAFPEDELALMRAYNADQSWIFDLLHKGAAAPLTRYAIKWDGANTLLPHLTRSRQSARMLVLKMWVDAEDGRASEATQDAIDALALARPLEEEPGVISALVAAAIYAIVAREGTERVLARSNPSNDDLERLQKAFLDSANLLNAGTALRGEVSMWSDMFGRFARGELDDAWWSTGGPTTGTSAVTRFLQRFGYWISRGQAARREARIIRVLLALVKDSENPSPNVLSKKRVDADEAAFAEAYRFLGNPNAQSEAGPGTIIVTTEAARARLRSTAACIAALRYKNDNGRWPDTLDALVPQYLDKAPLDPFTGKPLLYKTVEGGIMVYSVGQNRSDDDGRPFLQIPPANADKEWQTANDDIGFRIWR